MQTRRYAVPTILALEVFPRSEVDTLAEGARCHAQTEELFETLDLTYTCCSTGQQVYYSGNTTCRDWDGAAQPVKHDRDTRPLLLASRKAANDCIVHSIGLLTDPADGQAYRETVKMMFERLGRKGWPTRTKYDHEKVAGILNARWQLFERGASGVKLSECHIGRMIFTTQDEHR